MDVEELVHLGESLRYLINNIHIDVYQGTTVINLIDYLPLLKLGYTTYNELDNIMHIAEQLDPDEYDRIWKEAFAGNIPAEFYKKEPGNVITMKEAVRKGLLKKPLNSYKLLGEDGDYIKHNSDNIHGDKELEKLSIDDEFIDRISKEVDIIQIISVTLGYEDIEDNLIKEGVELKLFYDLMKKSGEGDNNDVVNILSTNDHFRLYIAIIAGNFTRVKNLLLTVDPRFDDNQAYVLAVEIGTKGIINLIKDQIIKDNWYEKQVYLANMENVAYDVYQYQRK